MKKVILALSIVLPLFAASQKEIHFFTAGGINAGYGANIFKDFNQTFTDDNGQAIGTTTFTGIDRGVVVGCRLRVGVEWRHLQVGFRFGYDRFLFRKHFFRHQPEIFPDNNVVTDEKLDFNVFSYSAFVGYSFEVSKRLNIIPQISTGSFGGFLRNYYGTMFLPYNEKWVFDNFMKKKFALNVSFLFEIPFDRFSFFITPEYSFIFWKNSVFAPENQTLSHISSGAVELGLKVKIYTLHLERKK